MTSANIVLSTRVRLARNVRGFVFPHLIKEAQAKILAKSVFDAINDQGDYKYINVKELSPIEALVMREDHLISNECVENKIGSVIINNNKEIVIMCNEEDHIREQCILPGEQLHKAYSIINKIDDKIAEKLRFCYSDRYGYLTSCITNLGTGLRASVMMFLPGLALTKAINKYIAAAAQLNLTIRGVYGEGTNSEGYIYQISNSRTLGISEIEILNNLQKTLERFIEKEQEAREYLLENSEDVLRDKVGRALGVLLYAHSLDTEEFMSLIALVKLGINLKILKAKNVLEIDKLIIKCQPAHIISENQSNSDAIERDKLRAKIVSKILKEIIL